MSSRFLAFCSATVCVFLMAGCSLQSTAPLESHKGSALQGMVHGGQQPIVGAKVYLMAANTSGYSDGASNPSQSLLKSASTGNADDAIGSYVLTQPDGSFGITGDYSCNAGDQVYLYVSGGNSGGGANSAIGLMTILGTCPAEGNFSTSGSANYIPYLWVNEVTTVAAAYAMAGFAADAVHVGAPSADTVNHPYAQQGIANAFLNAANLINASTGTALTATPASLNSNTPRSGTVPQTKINSMANILAACVNTNSPTSSNCSALFANTLSGGLTGTKPADTASAAIYLAHHPGASSTIITNLWNLQPSIGAAFNPALSAKPKDYMLSIIFKGGGMDGPGLPAIDAAGNVWLLSDDYNFTNGVNEFSPTGEAISPATQPGWAPAGFGQEGGLAIADNGSIWIYCASLDFSHGQVLKLGTDGSEIGAYDGDATHGDAGLSGLGNLAVDGNNNVWVANYGGNDVVEFDTNGILISGLGYKGGGVQDPSGANPDGIAIDNDGNAWSIGYQTGNLAKLSGVDGSALSPDGGWTSAFGLFAPSYVVLDNAGSAWTSSYGGIVKFSTSGQELSDPGGTGAAFTGGGISSGSSESYAGVIDGDGNLWVINSSTMSEFANNGAAISSSSGYGSGSLSRVGGIAIDGSGSVWAPTGSLPSSGSTPSTNSTLVQFIGAAAPVVTPLSTGVRYHAVGARP